MSYNLISMAWFSKLLNDFDLTEEIQEVYLHSFLFKLAEGLVAIFIPFYILESGFSILTVFLFFGIYYGLNIVCSLPFGALATKIGYKHTSLISSVFILSFYLVIRAAETESLLFLSAFLGGVGFNLYWMGMNPEVATSSDDDSVEEESGFFFSMPSLASIVSPLVGGLILLQFGFSMLFLFAALLMFGSFIPFAFSLEHKEGMDTSITSLLTKDILYDVFTYVFEGAHSIGEKVVWPLYLAIVIGGSLNIGSAGSILALGSAITSIFVGKITNPGNKGKVVFAGALMAALTLLLMSQVTSPLTAILISGLHGLTYTAVNLPIFSSAIRRAEDKDLVEYFIIRQISLGVGKLTTILLCLSFFLLKPENFFLLSFSVIGLMIVVTGYLAGKIPKR